MSERRVYDVIIIGAGSVGCPTAYFLARKGASVLVLDSRSSPGQGQNKAAIGGVRATHSDPAKITLCLKSLEVFSRWEEEHGTDIGWINGGYCFPVYTEEDENSLRSLLPVQKSHGLEIDWVDAGAISEHVPGINPEGLRGGTYSPGDGQVSPLKAAAAFWKEAAGLGAEFRFDEPVTGFDMDRGRVLGVKTAGCEYSCGAVLNAAGGDAREIGLMAGIEIPVHPDSHEAGISAPMERFFDPLIVDIRPGPEGRTLNFYFGQNDRGQVIFCYTPSSPIVGKNTSVTSEFMPVISRRLIDLIPRLADMLVRRVWRGLYPMTPDGIIILDRVREVEGLYLAVGMCGQGFMLGPGVGLNMAELILNGSPLIDRDVFDTVGFYRDFNPGRAEALK